MTKVEINNYLLYHVNFLVAYLLGVVLVVVLIVVDPDDGAAGPASYGRPSRGPTPARASSADSAEKPPGAELPPTGDLQAGKAQGRFGPRQDPVQEQRLNPLLPKMLPPNASIR